MTATRYATLATKCVLRHDPHYFASRVAFNAVQCESTEVTPELYCLLSELETKPLPARHVRQFADRLGEDHELGYEVLCNKGIIVESEHEPNSHPNAGHETSTTAVSVDVPVTSTPSQIELCITRRCNQACIHCNVSAFSASRSEQLPTSFWVDLIRQCAALRVLKVKLTGGEPFVREGFDEIYETLAGLPIAASILTNGTEIPSEYIGPLVENGHTLSISLDGAVDSVHDSFRRSPGAFAKTVQTMKRLGDAGVKFTINSVLHKDAIRQVRELLAIADRVGAEALVVTPMGAVGRGRSATASSYFPDAGDHEEAMLTLQAIAQETPSNGVVALLNPEEREMIEVKRLPGSTPMSRRPPGFCKAGIYAMAVDEDGIAYSCLRGLQERINPLGSLANMRLEDLWRSDRWTPFRDRTLDRVPCRVEHIAENPRLYSLEPEFASRATS